MGSFTKSLSVFRFLRKFLCHRSLINRSMRTKGGYIWNFVACDICLPYMTKNSSNVRIKVSHGMMWYDVVPIRSDSHCKQCRELSISILRVTKLICGENQPYALHCTSPISGFILKPEHQSSQCFYVPGVNWLQCFLTGLGRLRSQSQICHSLVFPYSVKI